MARQARQRCHARNCMLLRRYATGGKCNLHMGISLCNEVCLNEIHMCTFTSIECVFAVSILEPFCRNNRVCLVDVLSTRSIFSGFWSAPHPNTKHMRIMSSGMRTCNMVQELGVRLEDQCVLDKSVWILRDPVCKTNLSKIKLHAGKQPHTQAGTNRYNT